MSPARDKGPSVLKLGLAGQVARQPRWCWNSNLRKYCPERTVGEIWGLWEGREPRGRNRVQAEFTVLLRLLQGRRAWQASMARLERWRQIRFQQRGPQPAHPQRHYFRCAFSFATPVQTPERKVKDEGVGVLRGLEPGRRHQDNTR